MIFLLETENKFKIAEEFEGRPLYLDVQATTPLVIVLQDNNSLITGSSFLL